MEQSYQYAYKHVSYIQRIIDNIFLVKILNTHKKELIKFEDYLYKFYKTEKIKYILNDINVTIPNFIAVMSFSILLIVPRYAKSITLEFIGVTLPAGAIFKFSKFCIKWIDRFSCSLRKVN